MKLVERAWVSRLFGPYTLQAAIAAVHAEASDAASTDWPRIVALYTVLARADPSPVVELNRSVAVAMRDGPEAGLARIDAIFARGELADYHVAHSDRADFCRRLGRSVEARVSYERALALTQQEPERRFLEKKVEGMKVGWLPKCKHRGAAIPESPMPMECQCFVTSASSIVISWARRPDTAAPCFSRGGIAFLMTAGSNF